jgi:aldehyde dehydrogenase (NAD+)
MVTDVLNLVDGKAVPAAGGEWLERHSPVTGEVIHRLPRSGADDVREVVAAARRAQPAWAALTPVERGNVIRRAAELLRDAGDELVDIVRAETGKPRGDAAGELGGAVEMAYFVAGEGRRFYGRTTTSAVPGKRVSIVRSPIGVAGLIVASNTPLPNYAWKVFPALLCGNAAILKPSEDTPRSAERFAELLHDAGVPAGILNVVHGLGTEAGAAIVESTDVDIVSFTGSCAVGRWIQATAGARLAKVCLELGGKNPFVVCDDADLDRAVEAAAMSAFSNAGQRCAAGSRMLVFESVYEAFRDRLVARAKSLRVGAGDDAEIGPVVNERQLTNMLASVEAARAAVATVLTGGERLTGPGLDGGCFLAPTLVEEPGRDAEISRRELFGPITCLYRVRDLDDAIDLANDTDFGLTAAIWTRDVDRALAFVERVQAGMAVVNGPTYGSEPHMPFGGFKQSGNGFREAGTEALDVYSDWKSVAFLGVPDAR